MPNTTGERRLKPLINPEETPDQIMRRLFKSDNYEQMADYVSIMNHLSAYAKGGEHKRWDEYAPKIPADLRVLLGKMLTECRRNGFISPYIYYDKIKWRRVMTNGPQGDLCTLCSRDCEIRDSIDNGDAKWKRTNMQGYREPMKCWEAK